MAGGKCRTSSLQRPVYGVASAGGVVDGPRGQPYRLRQPRRCHEVLLFVELRQRLRPLRRRPMKIWKLAFAIGALVLSASFASAQQKITFTLNWVAGGDH